MIVMHKHESVRGYLLDALRSGLAQDGRLLPSERHIADRLGVSRPTVRRALERMAAEGRVRRVQGSGTFVAAPPTPAVRVLSTRTTIAGAQRSWKLDVTPAEALWQIERLRSAYGVPVALQTTYLVKSRTPDLLDHPLDASIEDLLISRYRIVIAGARESVTATVLHAMTAELLGAPPLAPALAIERVSWDQEGRRVQLTRSLLPGDRCELVILEP